MTTAAMAAAMEPNGSNGLDAASIVGWMGGNIPATGPVALKPTTPSTTGATKGATATPAAVPTAPMARAVKTRSR
jgi:hypothetical protein